MPMTQPQKKTLIVLLSWCAIQLLLAIGLLCWEFYAVGFPSSASLITTVVKICWAEQPWAILLTLLSVSLVVSFLFGHFFAGPKEELDVIRRNFDAPDPTNKWPDTHGGV